ncbi:ABC-type uncharacterized transport system periplasmic component-like protein [Candidatus Moduliflexus flocculans]|uniref:ABC-type uncharacterized transport system periplasmic component-like protein n=1 Tax=Candidatus Moduliflexus flocculans TaxID=1499966 RepID=A0A0S6VT51_9BACT|nr:ABC-type uncharacterized transport system periplasmic component-like protein [Candidatus Moduliflexus flocculans]
MVHICSDGIVGRDVFQGTMLEAAQYKVLVVMSYEEDFPWCREVKTGIDATLGSQSEIRYFYMDTKKDPNGGEQKAQEAYAVYQEFQPDGVITVDDNAQSLFVVPYLKDKVKTPVMFAGVNAAPDKYGYPAQNVSGILEREQFKESLLLAQKLIPAAKTFGIVLPDDATGKAVLEQIDAEKDQYPLAFTEAKTATTYEELLTMVEAFTQTSDLLFYITFEGLKDQQGQALSDKAIFPAVAKKFGKPILTNAPFRVTLGALCAVIKTGDEQGATASEMLLKAMQGTPIAEIPITQNQFGRRIINVTALKALGITPPADVLRGAELVKTEQ